MIYVSKTPEKQIDISRFYTYYRHLRHKNDSFIGQRHPFWEINIVLNGSMALTCDDIIITLSKGQMFLIHPDEFHSFVILEDHTEFLVLTFHTEYTIPLDNTYILSPANMQLVTMITEEIESEYPGDTFLRSGEPISQSIKLLTELLILRAVSLDSVPYTKSIHSDIYQTAVQFMKDNVLSSITLADIAKHCKVSVSTLKNLFKTHTQLGVMHFYNEIKMEHAKNMLTNDISITSIAEELRFSSVAHFSAAFKKYAGISPLKYKKRQN
ncbi:MAG: AraC family transcriptional regulator [Lachnospiraceae bacterium]|nr:AraC family transcriptional regulator [Lachnospiraceae bacterium]